MKRFFTLLLACVFIVISFSAATPPRTVVGGGGWGSLIIVTTTNFPHPRPRTLLPQVEAYYDSSKQEINVVVNRNIGMLTLEIVDENGKVIENKIINTASNKSVILSLPSETGDYILHITSSTYEGVAYFTI